MNEYIQEPAEVWESQVIPPESTEVRTFQERLASLLNAYNQEQPSDTPDYILAQYLRGCLAAFNRAVLEREAWYGRND